MRIGITRLYVFVIFALVSPLQKKLSSQGGASLTGKNIYFLFTLNCFLADILLNSAHTIAWGGAMEFVSVAEIARCWGVSERTARNYCASGRIAGAFLTGKTWNVPAHAARPERINKATPKNLLEHLQAEKAARLSGGIYHRVQIDLTYNSNHMEGSRLTHDQTRFIFETNTIGISEEPVKVDDIIEVSNHFRCIDWIIDNAKRPLNEKSIKHLHAMLKSGTSDSRKKWFAVGEYKRLPNEVGGRMTTPPGLVAEELAALLAEYNASSKTIDELIEFHVLFERIHPFQDGNGRIGRLILFKECLRWGIVPFIIEDDLTIRYYRGLDAWNARKDDLLALCRLAQDGFKKLLDYFRVRY